MSNEPVDPDESVEPAGTAVSDPATDGDDESAAPARASATAAPAPRTKRERTSPRQFVREVRSELRKVAWPSRKELLSYSLVVLVSVSLITIYITGLDQLFGTLILRMFGA